MSFKLGQFGDKLAQQRQLSNAMAAAAAAPLLGPLVALNAWTLAMEVWMYAERIPAINRSSLKVSPNMTKEQMNAHIPKPAQWKADNYNHLLEQPTQFYAVVLALTYLEANDNLTTGLAWTYVGIRVVHSLVQATVNKIMLRFQLFALSSVVLTALTARGAYLLLQS